MLAPPFDRRAIPAGAALSEWRASDGWTIRRLDWPPQQGRAARGSLIFAGGRGDFIEKYLESFAHWQGVGWHVTAFDWRGQGGSAGDIERGHIESFDPLVADGAALIAEWIENTPGPHAVIAHSMGGHLVMRILAEHRPALDAAVLVAPMLAINSAPLPGLLAPWVAAAAARIAGRRPAWREGPAGSPSAKFRQVYLTGSAERFDDEQWWKAQQPRFSLGPPTWGWLAAAYRSAAMLRPAALERVSVPLMLIGTDKDRLVSPTAIRRAAELVPGAELYMYADAAHELLRESDPVRLDAFARIDAFLDRHAPAR